MDVSFVSHTTLRAIMSSMLRVFDLANNKAEPTLANVDSFAGTIRSPSIDTNWWIRNKDNDPIARVRERYQTTSENESRRPNKST